MIFQHECATHRVVYKNFFNARSLLIENQKFRNKDLYIIVAFMKHMLQIRNDFELVEELRKEPKHIRELAKRLELIPSTVLRTIKNLEKEQVVDFTQEGRNKKYFLKETPEARNYVFMTEHYKLLKILQDKKLRRIINKIQENTDDELIVLFGSYAKGSAKETSDIDIFIETTNKKLREEIKEVSEKLSIKIGTLEKNNPLTKEFIKNHVIIQNVDRFYQLIT
jgi:predicted nucleotidyltransferase